MTTTTTLPPKVLNVSFWDVEDETNLGKDDWQLRNQPQWQNLKQNS